MRFEFYLIPLNIVLLYSLNAEDRVVRVEDVRKSIVSAAHFDFLTNRHLGSGGDSSSKTDTTIKKEGTH